jgi:YVTN family beta-propeller protein
VTPNGRHVYVTNVNANTVAVLDTTTHAVVTTIPVGTSPFDVAVAPNGRHVYVTNAGSNTVSVIDV